MRRGTAGGSRKVNMLNLRKLRSRDTHFANDITRLNGTDSLEITTHRPFVVSLSVEVITVPAKDLDQQWSETESKNDWTHFR